MDINQLQNFKTIAETGSLTRAAELLHISQPAMSSMLRKLEDELGAELFDRSPNRIRLNRAGELALNYANAILDTAERMKSELAELSQSGRSLSVGFCDPGLYWYCEPRFSVAHPEISLKCEMYDGAEPLKQLLDRTYDIVITPAAIEHRGVKNQSFLSDRVYLSVPNDNRLMGRETISLREIPGQAVLSSNIGGHFLNTINRITAEEALPITIVKNELNVILHMIRSTNFLSTVSTLSIELRNDGTSRTLIPLNDPELNVVYQISYLKSNSDRVRPVLSWAREITRQQKSCV